MNCPVCHDTRMREVEKDGILIDICPTCKGVWLDRGELEKLMSGVREIRPAFNQWYDEHDDHPRRDSYDDDRHRYDSHNNSHNHNQPHYNNKHKKKKSVLDVFGDLFD
ncbi:zf-TFIIB domain-containing protein [Paenibacillus sp. GCM10027629]|uniref:TFIIB-type zinc ribbon-containing protein n=1 Tax=Paenibacillus sp. GCM10027629 TaxID=3273414 RepID=UPI003638785C